MRPIIVRPEDKEEFDALLRESNELEAKLKDIPESALKDEAVAEAAAAMATRQIHIRTKLESFRDRGRESK